MKIAITANTDIGKERDQNEDAFVICPDLSHPDWGKKNDVVKLGPYGTVLAVADGMGGQNAGEVASSLAMASIQNSFSKAPIETIITSDEQIKEFIKTLVKNADELINTEMWNHPETKGMGTTIVICWILEERTYVAWCGDSRCYVYHPNSGLRALTKDHSYVQELVDNGTITEQEVFSHPDNHIITRGLGDFDAEAVPEIASCPTQSGNVFVLCSDGLCGYCTNKDIENTIRSYYPNASECCHSLMNLALNAGGHDNICIAVASVFEKDTISSSGRGILRKLFSRG